MDPLRGLKIPKEANPVRTVLSTADYAKILEVAQGVSDRFHLALVLCNETGHRISSVRSLRWQDVDLMSGVVKWPADHDKIKNEHETPLSDSALAALKAYRASQGVIAGWVFPGQGGRVPLERGRFYKWWVRACEVAEIERPRGAFIGPGAAAPLTGPGGRCLTPHTQCRCANFLRCLRPRPLA